MFGCGKGRKKTQEYLASVEKELPESVTVEKDNIGALTGEVDINCPVESSHMLRYVIGMRNHIECVEIKL